MYQVPVINRYQNKDVHGFSVICFSITFLNFNLHKITSKPVKTNLFEDCEPLFTEKKYHYVRIIEGIFIVMCANMSKHPLLIINQYFKIPQSRGCRLLSTFKKNSKQVIFK